MDTITEELNKTELLLSFDDTTTQLLQTLSSYTNEELNTVPFKGSWTAGQVGEHLLKSANGITKILNGNVQATERQTNAQAKFIESIFLDFTKKANAAKGIWPSDEAKEKEKLVAALRGIMDEIAKAAGSLDLSLTCMDFPFPTLGEFTRWEWVYFVICHTKKHIYQIENISKSLETNERGVQNDESGK